MRIIEFFSPNFNKKSRLKKSIKMVVIHYTGMQSERETIKRLCSIKSKVSCHYLINRKGKILRFIQDKYIAWHAGISSWNKYENLNKYSIGIELINRGHRWGYKNFTKIQIQNLISLCVYLKKKYKIRKKYFVGHSDIAPHRKIDPGEKFPWEKLSNKGLGIWHCLKSHNLKKNRKVKIKSKKDKINFIKSLKKVGYDVRSHNKKSVFFGITKAFQRHYRKELINGNLDRECFLIAKNLAKKV